MAAAAATGCYKCGRVGHWSKDCPSSSGAGKSGGEAVGGSPAPNGGAERVAGYGAGWAGSGGTGGRGGDFQSTFGRGSHYVAGSGRGQGAAARNGSGRSGFGGGGGIDTDEQPPVEKVVKHRLKVTPELLLSSDGIAYIKKSFPKEVIIKGPGHEVGDLKRLLEAYSQWHCRIFPSLTFPQFITKVEKVGATKRVRMALKDMRDGIDEDDNLAGGDADRPEAEENDAPTRGAEADSVSLDGSGHGDGPDADDTFQDVPEDIFEEAFQQATGEVPTPVSAVPCTASVQASQPPPPPAAGLSADQKARMEANRQLALEKQRARSAAAAEARARAQGESEGGPTRNEPEGGMHMGPEESVGEDMIVEGGAGSQGDVAVPLKKVLKIPGKGVSSAPVGVGRVEEGGEGRGGVESLLVNALPLTPEATEGEARGGAGIGEGATGASSLGGSKSADVAAPHTPAAGGCGENEVMAEENGGQNCEVGEVATPQKVLKVLKIPGRAGGGEGERVRGMVEGERVEGKEETTRDGQSKGFVDGGAVGRDEGGGEAEKMASRGAKKRRVAIDDDEW